MVQIIDAERGILWAILADQAYYSEGCKKVCKKGTIANEKEKGMQRHVKVVNL